MHFGAGNSIMCHFSGQTMPDPTEPSASGSSAPAEAVRYIIVVHGMGEARFNETVLPVIDRFAEIRSSQRWPPPSDILSLGMASGQTGPEDDANGRPWLDFEGIAANPDDQTAKPFYGEAGTSGLRFVDMHWKELLSTAWPNVGQDPDVWFDALIGRLRRRASSGKYVPQWALETLGVLRETVRLVHTILKLRFKDVDNTVFAQYLGDVQLYGEYSFVRGQAVRRFHDRLARIQQRHKDLHGDLPARYTIIAHSLGTVMAMDAILYAYAPVTTRSQKGDGRSMPLSGYINDVEIPSVDWVNHIDSFVTLGSPIDKFLTIWWLNYLHLNDDTWIEKVDRKIDHYNYCEVQDPVGQHLYLFESTKAYQKIFDCKEEQVYLRYIWPGLAHLAYWKDLDLFAWIAHHAVDRYLFPDSQCPDEPRWFSPQLYDQVLFISYYLIPVIVIALDVYTFTIACRAETWQAAVTASVVLFATTLLGRYLIDLTVWWRQILKAKHNQTSEPGDEVSMKNSLSRLSNLFSNKNAGK